MSKPNRKSSVRPGTLPRLLKYIFHYKIQLFIIVVCILIGAAANAGMALFVQTLIDSYILPMISQGSTDFAPLLSALGGMAVIYALGVISTLIYQRILVTVEQGTLKTIRDEMFEHMQALPIRYFDTHQHGDVMSYYINDTDTLRQAISQSLPQMFSSLVTVVVAYIAMLFLSVPLALFVLAYTVLLLWIMRSITTHSGKFFMIQQREIGEVNGFVEEAINGQKVIKVFTHEEATQKAFDEKNSSLYEASAEANTFGNITMPVVGNMGYLLYVIIAILGAGASLNEFPNFALTGAVTLTLGTLVSFLTLSRSYINPIGQISNQFNMVLMALAGASRIFELLNEEVEKDDGKVQLVNARIHDDGTITEASKRTDHWVWRIPQGVHVHQDVAEISKARNESVTLSSGQMNAISELTGKRAKKEASAYTELRGDIRFNHVDFSYNSDHQILHDITLYAKPGQKVALVGATGAGKTTITNLINRFYDISSGSILYDGINVADINKNDLRRSLGIVLQDVNLFTGTVMDNIRYGKLDATDDECIEAAKLANADGFIRMLPHGYNTILSGDGSGLSQGQRQLISIARAAVADPPVMILDEATSSIDTRTEEIVQAGMDALMEGRTVFVIAHRLSTVRNSDVIMVMDHGRIIERGTHDQLIEQRGQYYQLYTGAFELE